MTKLTKCTQNVIYLRPGIKYPQMFLSDMRFKLFKLEKILAEC